jgi:hypothetical protein
MNASRASSGDQVAQASSAGLFVRSVAPVPSAFMTQTSVRIWGVEGSNRLKAIFEPFGDQEAWKSEVAGSFVRSVCPLPSAFMT